MDGAAARRAVQGIQADELGELSAACGLPLDAFRAAHVVERIERALTAERLPDVRALGARLRRDPRARRRFRRSVAVSHSGLLRDPHQFEALERRILPQLLGRAGRLRIWSAGCANGLELWSVAIVLARLGALERAHLLGSDLLDENLAIARDGAYDVADIPADVRLRARWERRDLVSEPPPPGRWHLILCRNVAIYLAPAAKARLHRCLAGALAAGGVLMLGRSERLGHPAALGLRRREPHVYERPP